MILTLDNINKKYPLYTEVDTEGKSKIPIDAHIWIISESV